MRRRIVLLLTLLAVLWAPLAAHAQAKLDPAAKKKAAAHYKQGKAYMDAGLYDKAVEEYLASYAIAPANALLYNIARAYHLGGKPRQAIEWYQKFLDTDPDEELADEARELLVQARKELDAQEAEAERQRKAAEEEQRRKQAEAEQVKKREQADAHVKQAKAYLDAGAPGDASKEYVAAFELAGDPEHLFLAADAALAGGDKPGARALYRRYLAAAPGGARADEARKQVATLTRQIDEEERARKLPDVKDPVGPGVPGGPPIKAAKASGVDWGWVAIGVVLIGIGVAGDVGPASTRNSQVDGTDFVPLGLYGLGGAAMWVGVF